MYQWVISMSFAKKKIMNEAVYGSFLPFQAYSIRQGHNVKIFWLLYHLPTPSIDWDMGCLADLWDGNDVDNPIGFYLFFINMLFQSTCLTFTFIMNHKACGVIINAFDNICACKALIFHSQGTFQSWLRVPTHKIWHTTHQKPKSKNH